MYIVWKNEECCYNTLDVIMMLYILWNVIHNNVGYINTVYKACVDYT